MVCEANIKVKVGVLIKSIIITENELLWNSPRHGME